MDIPLRLNLGCGQVMPAGWLNIDCSWNILLQKNIFVRALLKKSGKTVFYPNAKSCIHMNLNKRWNVPDGSVGIVYSSHALEHLSARSAEHFMEQAFRVLKREGVLRIVVPDLFKMAQQYVDAYKRADRNAADQLLRMLNLHREAAYPGGRKKIRNILAFFHDYPHQHKYMYDALSLKTLMQRHGFVDCLEASYGVSRYIPEIKEVEFTAEGVPSIYIEAKKGQR